MELQKFELGLMEVSNNLDRTTDIAKYKTQPLFCFFHRQS